MNEKELKHFRIINPNAMNGNELISAGCHSYQDAPVCIDGNTDITCGGERYRGCPVGARDCADSPDNPDDLCCWGPVPVTSDNIDHELCRTIDAGWGCIGNCWDWGWEIWCMIEWFDVPPES